MARASDVRSDDAERALAAEVACLEADDDDRAEMAVVATFMESLRPVW